MVPLVPSGAGSELDSPLPFVFLLFWSCDGFRAETFLKPNNLYGRRLNLDWLLSILIYENPFTFFDEINEKKIIVTSKVHVRKDENPDHF